jgi:hypothetical protein
MHFGHNWLKYICIPLYLLSALFIAGWAAEPIIELNPSPVAVSLEQIDNATIHMSVTCPDEPLQYLQQGNDRRICLEYESEGLTTEEGKASLPLITRFIAIPPNNVLHVEITSRHTRTVENAKVVPVVPDGDDPQTHDWIDDETWLQSDEAYPRESVVVGQGMRMRNLWLVPVTVSPTRYYPQEHRLEMDTDLEIEMTLENSSFHDPSIFQGPLTDSFDRLYKAVVANYDLLEIDQEPVRGTYLIICADNQTWVSELDGLVEWKQRMGYPVHVATTAETGTSTTSIRNYIRNAYDTWERPPEFVCIVGDADGSYSIPTDNTQYDHFYSMMDADILADVLVGRLSASDINTLRTIVNKILYYESQPFMGVTNWYRKGMVIAGSGSGTSTIHTKRSACWRMLQSGFVQVDSVFYIYTSSYITPITNAFNNGIAYLNYRGYMGMSGWSNSNTDNLSNGFMLPIVTTLTCGTGTFNSGTSLTEGFLRAGSPTTPKGGIASIGTATTSTHTRYNNCIDVGIYAGIFDEDMVHLGEALVRGKLELARNYPTDATATGHIYWNNLMGDPGLRMWKRIPQPLAVQYDDTIALGTNAFEMHIVDANDTPIEGAYACLWQEGGTLYEMAYSDANGEVELNCSDAELGTFFVTVTKPQYIPYLGQTTVITAVQALAISSINLDDDGSGQSQGNGNGLWNPNERVEIRPVVWNRGTQQIDNVQATLTSDDALLTVVQSVASIGLVSAGDSAQVTSAFVVDLNPCTPADHLCRLRMNLQGTGYSQTLYLDVNAVSYRLEILDVTVNDGNNGLLEPGETSNILVRLSNQGSTSANGITAILRVEPAYWNVIDSVGSYGNISVGSSVQNTSNPFSVQASDSVIPGMNLDFQVIATSSDGMIDTAYGSLRIQVSYPVGQPLGPDEYGYFCFDNTDAQYPQAPFYAWIEIDPNFGGQGTQINLTDYGNEEDDTELVMLPFIFRYYGRSFDRISVCSNGFIAMGDQTYFVNFRNWIIPSPLGAPAMIAPFWDDLVVTSGSAVGKVYYWHDEINGIFVVEWSHVRNRGTGTPEETFEVILYDPAHYPTASGDGDIAFQYNQIANVTGISTDNNYATVGIEDFDQLDGIQYTFNNQYPAEAATLSAGRAIKFTTGPGLASQPPIITLHPNSFSFALEQGQQAADTLWVGNAGASALYFSILALNEQGRPLNPFPNIATWPYQTISHSGVVGKKDSKNKSDHGQPGLPAIDGSGGPDTYGYIWIDSDELNGPEYHWVDISQIGTEVQWQIDPDEESFGPVDIGFNFPFYGTLYNTLQICSNGYLSFTDTLVQFANRTLPNFDAPATLVSTWWDDVDPEYGGHVYYWSNQVDSFIVTFDDVPDWRQEGLYTFQTILTRTGKVKYQYNDMGTGRLDEMTIGIQDETKTIGLTVAYNTLYVHNQMAVEFQAPLVWLAIDPSQGSVNVGDSTFCLITANSQLLDPGQYGGLLRVMSNDIQEPVIELNVDMLVTTNGEVPPTVLDIPDQTINEGENFQSIVLDNYVTDPVYSPEQITWTSFGAMELEVTIVNRVATISTPYENWFGDETITFRATNPLNLWDSDPATFTVQSINDPPVIDPQLPDVTFRNDSLATLVLDDYGSDVEDPDSLLTWTFSGNNSVHIMIDESRVATFTSDPGFVGQEQVIFTLHDTEEGVAADTILVNVEPSSSVASNNDVIPDEFFLGQNYPNPFNPSTVIRFGLPQATQVKLIVYNILGQEVATLIDDYLPAGYHEVIFEAAGLSSGLYFLSITTPNFRAVRKMALMR